MPVATLLTNKVIIGAVGLLLFLNINFTGKYHISSKIYNYHDNLFYGELSIDNRKLPMIIEIEGDNEKTINTNINKEEDINKKEDKKEFNEKVVDDKTPGSIKIKIKDEKGKEIIYDRKMGSGKVSEFDQACINKITDSLVDYMNSSKGKSVTQSVKKFIYGFVDYCNNDSHKERWFKWIK